ncbi:hypothetical protein SISSUDRAFT_1057768 [Sistotremastrum suecicum HHB10207 ss-3]|uniref:AA9 family lytic polysaccharide monooxygenase n=1 Tax=Sistotremastrum suecicum HHB10207 ss-3 TaxID=1314776 RepID=A0A166I3V3_9AGAM|nr:hypothetical protein SISSUDRAFT_1057768 [Sistotremastrum suecicum HHB10207 ss-3]
MLFYSAVIAASIASVAAHATFQELWINGVDQGGYCVRAPQSNSPVTSVTSNDIACNVNANPSPGTCAINAGDTLTVEMHQQPGDRSCADEAIGGAHYGPINIYLAKVADASSAVGSSAAWFKISEMGLPSSDPDYWATEVLNDNCGHYTFKVPSDIAPGQYLLRAEVIALHVASSVGGAQFYMSCYQITIGGSGSAAPPTVSIPGTYNANDPGILINIYTQLNTYQIPGPSPYGTTSPTVATTPWPTTATWNTAGQPSTDPTTPPAGSGSKTTTSSSTSSTSTSKSTTTTTTSSTTTTTSSTSKSTSTTTSSSTKTTSTTSSTTKTTTSTASGATQTKYGQCGGIGWSGPTTCASGSTCTVGNAYYSQCL